MCSINVDMCSDIEELNISKCDEFESFHESKPKVDICRKCGDKTFVLLQKKDPFCKSCFVAYCHHKFKATIGKAKKIKPTDKILIAVSCGAKSLAMLDMVIQALRASSHKRLMSSIGVVYIDESAVLSCESDEVNEALQNIKRKIADYNCRFLYSSIEMAFRKSHSKCFWEFNDPDVKKYQYLKEKLTKSLSSLKSLSSKLQYIDFLKSQLMIDIAASCRYTHLFMGDSATSLSTKFFSDIALGRGFEVSNSMGFYDDRFNVAVCRPMREFLNKEIYFYNVVANIRFVTQPTLLTMTDSQASVQRLTETFINGLQKSFPSTVFTIFRTGAKISSGKQVVEDDRCIICKSYRDNLNPDPCSAVDALAFSNLLVPSKESGPRREELDRFRDQACHGCQIMIDELDSCQHLPPRFLQDAMNTALSSGVDEEMQGYISDDED